MVRRIKRVRRGGFIWRSWLAGMIGLLAPCTSAAQNPPISPAPNAPAVAVRAVRVTAPPRIDGKLDEEIYRTATPMTGVDGIAQGSGELNINSAVMAATPTTAAQSFTRASGTGTLEGARGTAHVADTESSVELTGERDIMGKAWSPATWTVVSAAGNAWVGGTWNGNVWAGSGWTGTSWASKTWSSTTWTARTWSGSSWTARTWSSAGWTGSGWSARTWSARTWSARTWSGGYWASRTWK